MADDFGDASPIPSIPPQAGRWEGNIFRSYVLVNRWMATAAGRIDSSRRDQLCLFASILNACREQTQP